MGKVTEAQIISGVIRAIHEQVIHARGPELKEIVFNFRDVVGADFLPLEFRSISEVKEDILELLNGMVGDEVVAVGRFFK